MKLVACMIVSPVEVNRYLTPCVKSLLTFCDEVTIWQDGWTFEQQKDYVLGGDLLVPTTPFKGDGSRVICRHDPSVPGFFENEGTARQAALDLCMSRDPTHILAIDADEFVTDGKRLREACEQSHCGALDLCMMEVWGADKNWLTIRQDGGWLEHDVTAVYQPSRMSVFANYIEQRPLACGRVPRAVSRLDRQHSCTGILHFGWANVNERQARYDRYVKHDGGRYHARPHLDSIMLPDDQIQTTRMRWPVMTPGVKPSILRSVRR